MSMNLMVKAFEARIGNPVRKLILLRLADNANDDGACWPSYNKIAYHCEVDRSTVIRHVKALEEMGYLTRTQRPGPKGNTSNMFHISIPTGVVAENNHPSGSVPPPQSHSATPLVAERHPESVIESINESKPSSSADDALAEAFECFWNMGMKKINKVSAKRSFKKAVKGKNADEFLGMLAHDIETRIATGQQGFTEMHPTTYLNGQRWEDERSDCPHRRILEAWHEVMPDHISKPALEDWLRMEARQRLTDSWETFKVKKRKGQDGPVIPDVDEGVRFMREMIQVLARVERIHSPEAAQWCTFAWFSKFESIMRIGKGEMEGVAA